VILDISGSMNLTSNTMVNLGAGFINNVQRSLSTGLSILSGGLMRVDRIGLVSHMMTRTLFTTRLNEAKRHLIIQIRALIRQERIRRIGLITFNSNSRVDVDLTTNF
jgi:hypothetical protein